MNTLYDVRIVKNDRSQTYLVTAPRGIDSIRDWIDSRADRCDITEVIAIPRSDLQAMTWVAA